MRRYLPRFQPDAFEQNFKLVEAVERIANRHGASVAQLTIAWVRRQGAIPFPRSTKVERFVENRQDLPLTEQDLDEIQTLLQILPVAGERYGGQHEKLLYLQAQGQKES
ncbi:hypothetical protein N657DRAFT_645436 [Parathielavia appendiculata]|uniref:NADP-dependent oxidoreductase domain-containing protein n=1 Tax=Parathielavia appendiculata TaxID=2587402 RepID=A0AAN6TZZ4_9PEZI|nr:hypothetical protein N657DRAFT_645436 [Parathielavia appendiculata]